jgi:hypothetical protein
MDSGFAGKNPRPGMTETYFTLENAVGSRNWFDSV